MPRKALDGAKLAADIDRLEREDKTSPPTAQPSLMDAVRGLATYIETRARLGWTDPMIAAVLTNAGYPISADTLRSYRKRLRDEGLMAPLPVEEQKNRTRPPAAIVTTVPLPTTVEVASTADAIGAPATVMPSGALPRTAAIPTTEEAAMARAPPEPGLTPSPARTFRVDPTKLPPDRA
ncbi:MAG: hypothetical protein KYX69_02750 [Sphingomonas sp.]|uniref:hypothetical protein n=1 Tax=Sphingomonas sp. TaxID=28214 RepID=UPI0026129F07|nr:hypothetical protein [Sphingomonas sp.]MDK2766618.1 hypothetical protein [Sphingomonas sp.]